MSGRALGASAAALLAVGIVGVAAAGDAEHDAATRARSLVRRNAECAACHEREASEHATSMHRQSHDDETYLASLRGEPTEFCERCHTPLAAAEGGAALGIGCTGCHADDGHRGAPARPMAAVRCEPCHEFRFPHGSGLMQRTVSEHRASTHASASCASCHLPIVGDGAARHRAHGTPASRDRNVLARAVRASAALVGPGSLVVTLEARAVGHAVPTGDMFRRLAIRAEVTDAAGRIVSRAEKLLARRFVSGPAGPVETGDDRVPASGAPVSVGLDLGEVAASSRVRWHVDYERVVNGLASSPVVAGVVEIASGDVR